MVTYDSFVIVEFAEKLYKQAATLVVTHTVVGTLVGMALGAGLSGAIQSSAVLTALVGAALVGGLAFQIGQQKAFSLRLQAQIALCQVEIETNTRNASRRNVV